MVEIKSIHINGSLKKNPIPKVISPNNNKMATEDNNNEQAIVVDSNQVDLKLVDELRDLIKEEFNSNEDKYAPKHFNEIMNPESPLTCWRYLIHKELKIADAFELMKASLKWRKDSNGDSLDRSDLIKEFWHFSPISFSGKSKDGHDVLYVLGKNYKKPDHKLKPYIPKFGTNLLLSWDRKHNLDLNKVHIVFDVSDCGYKNVDLDFMSWLVSIRDYLPARWHQISVVGIPFIIKPFIHLILGWLPENFKKLVYLGNFQDLVRSAIDDDNLPIEVAGTRDESYKLAPLDAPWASESEVFQNEDMQKKLEYCIVMKDEKRSELRKMQLDYERKLKT